MPWSARSLAGFIGGGVGVLLGVAWSGYGKTHDLLLGGGTCILNFACDPALVHDEDSVRHAEDLGQVSFVSQSERGSAVLGCRDVA